MMYIEHQEKKVTKGLPYNEKIFTVFSRDVWGGASAYACPHPLPLVGAYGTSCHVPTLCVMIARNFTVDLPYRSAI